MLLHQGRLPSPGERRLLDALLIGVADHGAGAPSCAAARLAASGNRSSISSAIAAGILAIGDDHGGAGSNCMELIAAGLRRREARGADAGGRGACARWTRRWPRSGGCPGWATACTPPIRASQTLFDMARAEGIAGDGILFMEALEAQAAERIKPLPMNIDGALAAILHDMGFAPPAGRFLFIIGRVAGLTRRGARKSTRAKSPCASSSTVDYDGVLRRSTSNHAMARTITAEETQVVQRARRTRAGPRWRPSQHYDQATVDRLCQAVAWAGGNLETATRLANMSVDESGMGRREPTRRAKVQGILRDALRQKSMGVIEEDPDARHREVRQARGRDRRADPGHQPLRDAGRHRHLRAQVQGRGDLLPASVEPHDDDRNRPHHARGAREARRARGCPAGRGAPEHSARERADVGLRSHDRHRRPRDGEGRLRLWQARVRRRRRQRDDGHRRDGQHRGSRAQHAHQQDQRQRLGLLRRRQPAGGLTIYDAFLAQLQAEGGYLVNDEEKAKLQAAYWDAEGRRTADTIARGADVIAKKAGIALPDGKTFFIVPERQIGKEHPFSTEKLGVVLAIFKYHGWDMALDMVRQIFETGGTRALVRDLFVRR